MGLPGRDRNYQKKQGAGRFAIQTWRKSDILGLRSSNRGHVAKAARINRLTKFMSWRGTSLHYQVQAFINDKMCPCHHWELAGQDSSVTE